MTSLAPIALTPSPTAIVPLEDWTPPAPIRTSYDSDSEDDVPGQVLSAKSTPKKGEKGHKPRPSTSRLLPLREGEEELESDRRRTGTGRWRPEQMEMEELEDGQDAGVGWWNGTRKFVRRNEGFLLIGLSQAFFALINASVKVLQERVPIPVWEIIAVRMLPTYFGSIAYLHWVKNSDPWWGPKEVRVLLCCRGAVGFGGLFGIYYSLKYLSLSDASVLAFLSPVLTGILASIFLHEAYSRTEALTGVGSLFGVLLIAKPSFLFPASYRDEVLGPGGKIVTPDQRAMAVAVAMLGVLGAAGAYLLIRKIGHRASALHSIAYFSLYSFIVAMLYPLFVHAPPVFIFDVQFISLILPIGFLGFTAQVLLTLGLQKEKAGRGTLAVYSNLLFAMILERMVFGKLPDFWSLIGSGIIVGGAVYVALDKGRPKSLAGERRREEELADVESAVKVGTNVEQGRSRGT